MEIRKYKNIGILLLLLIVFPITHFSMQFSTKSYSVEDILSLDSTNPTFLQETDRIVSPTRSVPEIWSLSDMHEPDPASGILNPVLVEQSGYFETGDVSARTDTAMNTEQTLAINTGNDWVASRAEVDVWNLEKMYVVNGTFDQGIAGYTLIPISEVIRTVPTENLICAFITVTPPSVEQELKMVGYTRAIGMMLDDSLALLSAQIIDAKTSKTLEWLFDDLMDGILVRSYQTGEKEFSKQLRFIEKGITLEETDGSFNLARLVRLLASTEISEDDVYIRVMKAIEDEYILPVHPYDNDVDLDSG